MSALLQSLADGFQGDGARRDALDAVLAGGLPHARNEAWKYTSLRALERRTFVPSEAGSIDPRLVAGVPAPRVVFVNGHLDPVLSDMADLPEGLRIETGARSVGVEDDAAAAREAFQQPGEVFARLNTALAGDGVRLCLAEGVQVDAPVHLVFVGAPAGGQDMAWHLRHSLLLEAGSSLRLVEHQLAGAAHAHLSNMLLAVDLGPGARLWHGRIQDEHAGATLIARTDARLAKDATYQRVDLELGASLSRHELNVDLRGHGARVEANGVLLATGRRHLDTRLGIEHAAPGTSCDLLWRGLGVDRGRAVFHGGIVIHPGADGSAANLSNKNLLLSEGAEIDTQPVLEIHADEVTAAHGATVGRLDPTALFYLRSRGLPHQQAARLLTAAFCREAAASAPTDALRELMDNAMDRALARLESP